MRTGEELPTPRLSIVRFLTTRCETGPDPTKGQEPGQRRTWAKDQSGGVDPHLIVIDERLHPRHSDRSPLRDGISHASITVQEEEGGLGRSKRGHGVGAEAGLSEPPKCPIFR